MITDKEASSIASKWYATVDSGLYAIFCSACIQPSPISTAKYVSALQEITKYYYADTSAEELTDLGLWIRDRLACLASRDGGLNGNYNKSSRK